MVALPESIVANSPFTLIENAVTESENLPYSFAFHSFAKNK